MEEQRTGEHSIVLIVDERRKRGEEEVKIIWKHFDTYTWDSLDPALKRSSIYNDFKKRKEEQDRREQGMEERGRKRKRSQG